MISALLSNGKVVQKIKRDLIHKAKVKKSYAKLKQRELQDSHICPSNISPTADVEPAGLELHPARQAMLNEPGKVHQEPVKSEDRPRERKPKRLKPVPFSKEARKAQQLKEEADRRHKVIEEANIQRQQKIEERERFRRAMAKARIGGKNGQRKLGRESRVLLEKVKRVMNE